MAHKFVLALSFWFMLIAGQNVFGVSRVWTGTSGYWTNEAMWGGTVPQTEDTVTFPAGAYTVTLDSATAELGSFIQNGGTLVFTNWDTCLRSDDVLIQAGKMDHSACDTNLAPGVTNRVYILAHNVTIGSGGLIDVSGRGYPGTTNAGMGPGGGAVYCWGGSYGGMGGKGHLSTGSYTPVYGMSNAPAIPGSGGGGAGTLLTSYGAAGGGVVRIEATGLLKVDGTIAAVGFTPPITRGGGGSGGSIFLSCQTFDGDGVLNAAGGGSGSSGYGGGGGGGRVALVFDSTAQSNAGAETAYRVLLEGGRGIIAKGDPGTLYVTDPQNFPNPLPRNAILHVGVNPLSLTLPSLTLTNFSLGFGDANVSLEVAGDLAILATNGVYGFSMEPASRLSVGGNIVMTNTFLRMVSSGAVTSELACAGSMSIRDAKVDVRDMTIQGDLSVYSPSGTNGVSLTNGPVATVGGDILLRTNAFLTLVSRTNGAAVLHCGGTVKLDTAVLTTINTPTGVFTSAYSVLVDVERDLVLTNNAWIMPRLDDSRNASNTAGHALFRMRNLTVSTNSGFNGDGLGYAGIPQGSSYTNDGFGPGGGHYYAGGGGHGGTGGVGHSVTGPRYGGSTYGDSNAPVQPGSGGANAGGNGAGGSGGGSAVIEASRTVSLDGLITVNGSDGFNRGGGGSGGSIFITCAAFAGSGTLRANGGKGGPGNVTYGGGGGGGRIAVGRNVHVFSGSPTVSGGAGPYQAGLPGTLVWLDLPAAGSGAVILIR